MTELSRKILENHQVRKSYKQKSAFIELLKGQFPGLWVQDFSLWKCRNLIVGDIASADIILSAHYDTCAQLPFPNFISPKKPLLSILYGFVPVAFLVAVTLLANISVGLFTADPSIHKIVSLAVYFGLFIMMFAGPANKHTANDNTSGVIVLCELLQVLSPDTRKKVAFVFFDQEELGLIGSSLFRKQYKKVLGDKLLINFDCVSDGDHILVSASKGARAGYGHRLKEAFQPTEEKSILFTNAEKTYYPSDQKGFPNGVAIAVLKHKPFLGYYMDRIHTKRDTVFQEENILHICNCMLRFLRRS